VGFFVAGLGDFGVALGVPEFLFGFDFFFDQKMRRAGGSNVGGASVRRLITSSQ
jgi:hypothetical protein